MEWIYNIDFGILDLISNMRFDAFDKLMALITHSGDMGIVWIALALCLLFSKKYRKCGIVILVSLAVCAIFTSLVIKPWVGRLRPFQFLGIEPHYIAPPSGYSFPSGHTSSSFTAATSVFLCHKKEGIAAYILAMLIAFSRMYFYVHFPTDVLCGGVLGILCALGVKKLLSKRLQKM